MQEFNDDCHSRGGVLKVFPKTYKAHLENKGRFDQPRNVVLTFVMLRHWLAPVWCKRRADTINYMWLSIVWRPYRLAKCVVGLRFYLILNTKTKLTHHHLQIGNWDLNSNRVCEVTVKNSEVYWQQTDIHSRQRVLGSALSSDSQTKKARIEARMQVDKHFKIIYRLHQFLLNFMKLREFFQINQTLVEAGWRWKPHLLLCWDRGHSVYNWTGSSRRIRQLLDQVQEHHQTRQTQR